MAPNCHPHCLVSTLLTCRSRPTDPVKWVCYVDDLTVWATWVNILDIDTRINGDLGEMTAPKVFRQAAHPGLIPSQDTTEDTVGINLSR